MSLLKFFFKSNLLLVILASVLRLIFFFKLSQTSVTDLGLMPFLNLIFTGMRFDLMVLGFANVVTMVLLLPVWKTRLKLRNRIWIFYYGLLSYLFSVATFFDMLYFSKYADRFNEGILFGNLTHLRMSWSVFGWTIALIMAIWFFTHSLMSWFAKWHLTDETLSWRKWAVLFLLTGLAARGSLGPLHLDLRHSEISENKFVNLTTLNSLYTLDQGLRRRR